MPNSNGAGADTPEQNSHDAGFELFQAASSGNVSMAQALLSVTCAQSYINYTDGHGRTSLFKAACNGHIPIVAHLMAARCSINLATATRSTPLLVAARKDHDTIVSELIAARYNVDIAKMDGTTPLFIAAKHGHVAVVAQLIAARCHVNLARTDGVTPFLMATEKGHRVVVRMLIATRCDVYTTFVVGMALIISCHYERWSTDMLTNRAVETDFYKKTPAFKKENPDLRWRTTLDSATRTTVNNSSDQWWIQALVTIYILSYASRYRAAYDHASSSPRGANYDTFGHNTPSPTPWSWYV
jgi:ankyrin repeat protein